jgi:hypothetical protein
MNHLTSQVNQACLLSPSCDDNEAPRPAPPPPRFARFASSSGPPPPISRGRKEKRSRSRDAPASEACRPKLRIVIASKKMKGGGAPKRRDCLVGPRHAADVAIHLRFGRRPRVQRNALASRRSTAVLPSAMCRSSIQAALHAMQCAGVTCALASRLSEAPRAPVVMPAGSMPGPPESGIDEPPPAGTAPAPSVGVTG